MSDIEPLNSAALVAFGRRFPVTDFVAESSTFMHICIEQDGDETCSVQIPEAILKSTGMTSYAMGIAVDLLNTIYHDFNKYTEVVRSGEFFPEKCIRSCSMLPGSELLKVTALISFMGMRPVPVFGEDFEGTPSLIEMLLARRLFYDLQMGLLFPTFNISESMFRQKCLAYFELDDPVSENK